MNLVETPQRKLPPQEQATSEESRIVPASWERGKRIMDVTIALIVLIFTLPISLLAILGIWWTSPGPPIFVQKRVGRFGRMFSVYKLRTMIHEADKHHRPLLQKQRHDPLVTPIGKLLRKTSIDELPNLINVLRGEMSIVGPRPMLQNELSYCIERHGETITAQRLLVRPGLTGLWQISGRSHLDFDRRVALDVEYALTWTPLGDLRIFCATPYALLTGRGAF